MSLLANTRSLTVTKPSPLSRQELTPLSIEHKGKNINIEATGIVFNYTSADFWFILFILEFLSSDENGYIFPDVDYIIQHSEIVKIDNEIPIYEMPAEILIGRCGIWE